jgi:hypothetical protein
MFLSLFLSINIRLPGSLPVQVRRSGPLIFSPDLSLSYSQFFSLHLFPSFPCPSISSSQSLFFSLPDPVLVPVVHVLFPIHVIVPDILSVLFPSYSPFSYIPFLFSVCHFLVLSFHFTIYHIDQLMFFKNNALYLLPYPPFSPTPYPLSLLCLSPFLLCLYFCFLENKLVICVVDSIVVTYVGRQL